MTSLENLVEQIRSLIKELKASVGEQISKRLGLTKNEQMVEKLNSFSHDCEECQQLLHDTKNHLIYLNENIPHIDMNQHKKITQKISTHLQKTHKLLPEGYYLSLYMSIGISIGVVFGLTIFDSIALGIPIGMSIGLAIGAGLDGDAKKKGKTI